MAAKKKKSSPRKKPVPPETLTHEAIRLAHKAAIILEKARLEDYMLLLNKPWRMFWLNFWAGLARGVGFIIGTTIIAAILLFLAIKGLHVAVQHAGGLPWIGDQLQVAIQWVLDIVDKHNNG